MPKYPPITVYTSLLEQYRSKTAALRSTLDQEFPWIYHHSTRNSFQKKILMVCPPNNTSCSCNYYIIVMAAKHRALLSARKLKGLFTRSPLKIFKKDLQRVSYRKVLKGYRCVRDARVMREKFPMVTRQQATKLAQCRLSTKRLQSIYDKENSPMDFDEAVRQKGIKSSALRNKLYVHLSNEKRE